MFQFIYKYYKLSFFFNLDIPITLPPFRFIDMFLDKPIITPVI